MKKILSMILALAMLISLVPAAFANDTSAETYSGVKVEYDLVKGPGYDYDADRTKDLKEVTLDTTSGFWGYNSQSNDSTSNTFKPWKANCVQMIAKANEWVALEIYVPAAGKYDVSLNYGQRKSGDTPAKNAGIWILLGSEYTKDEITAALNANTPIASGFSYLNSTNVTDVDTEPKSFYFPNAGKHLVVFKCIEGYSSTKGYMYPHVITLDGKGENVVPMSFPVSINKTELTLGGTEADATAQITLGSTTTYMSNGEAATIGSVSYTSDDNNIATVDAQGKITAVAVGKATITATATITTSSNTYTASTSMDINVNMKGSGVTVNYEFGTDAGKFVEGTDAGYGFVKSQELTSGENKITFAKTKGFWQFYTKSGTGTFKVTNGYCACFASGLNDWIALEIYVPKAGKYDVTLNHGFMKNTTVGAAQQAGMWILPLVNETTGKAYTKDQISAALTEETAQTVKLDFLNDEDAKSNAEGKTPAGNYYFPEAGTYLAVYKALAVGNNDAGQAYMYLGRITLDGKGTDVAPMAFLASLDKEELTLGSDTDATAQMSVDASVYMNDGKKATVGSVSYASGKESVATVNASGLVTAVGTGTATITASATATSGETSYPLSAKCNIKVLDKIATDEVSSVQFMATSTIANNAGVTTNIDGYTVGITTDAIAVGETVEVTAEDVEGYIFRGWKRGSADNGVWVSTSAIYSFPLLTNTYLTAIYDVDTAEDADVNVEFYNFNGQFITSKAINGAGFGTLASGVSPTLTGYNSFFWTIDGENAVADDTVFNKLTRVVAKFTDKDSFAVTVPTNVTSDKASDTYEYDTEIAMSADNAGVWKVNGKQVAYGTSFTYTVWSAATITFEEKANDGKPILSLDTAKTDGARMISYDANGATIVEAGILFGANATIESANSRAVSRQARGNVSGQFTAKPYSDADVDNATAYLIYNDKGTYRVIYAD